MQRDRPALKPDNPYERHAAHRGGDPRPASAPSPEPPDEPSEPRYVRAQVAQPTENSPGEIAEGSFTVAGGMLTVFDSDGCRLGSLALRPGDNVEAAARKILREKKAHSFYAPIQYPRTYH